MGQTSSSLSVELEAMGALGRILCDLPDPAARHRVLTWAIERFASEGESGPPSLKLVPVSAPAQAQAPGNDPALAIDSLDEMFTTAAQDEMDDDLGEFAGPPPRAAVAHKAPQPLEIVIRSFAEDFQRFVDEWNGATA